MSSLPLFPLGAVLVPGERLPLRIFERRYVVMLRDLLRRNGRGEDSEFGIVGIRLGQEIGEDGIVALHEVGCAARLISVDERESGFEVIALGTRRFRLDGLDENRRTPYLMGFATWLTDRVRDPELVSTLAARLRTAVAAYRDEVGLDPVELPSDVTALSHLAARQVMLDRADRQRLLEARDVDERLRLTLSLTRRETALQRELGAFPGAFTPAEPAAN